MPRDALWVTPNGTTTVVTLDDDGNPIDPIKPVEPEPPEAKPRKPGRPRKQT